MEGGSKVMLFYLLRPFFKINSIQNFSTDFFNIAKVLKFLADIAAIRSIGKKILFIIAEVIFFGYLP